MLWTSGDSYVIGWFDPDKYDPARPETLERAQGWSEIVVDTDGDGEKDTPARLQLRDHPEPGRRHRLDRGGESADRGDIVRYDPASDTHRGLHAAGARDTDRAASTSTPRASSGPAWAAAATWRSSTAPSARQTWGTGDQCPEGWTLYRSPGPQIDTGDGPGERDQRRLPLLPLGRPVQHPRHGQGHGDPERHRLGLAAGLRPEDREVHRHPRARTR